MDWWLSGLRRLSWKQMYVKYRGFESYSIRLNFGERGIWTHVGFCQQIYSLSPFPLSHFSKNKTSNRRSRTWTYIRSFGGHSFYQLNYSSFLVRAGFEPTTQGLWFLCSTYWTILSIYPEVGLNHWPLDFQSNTLPTELPGWKTCLY